MGAMLGHRGLLLGAEVDVILSLFAAGEQGVWWDVQDLSTMFQDSAGTTPAVVGQPVGLHLDKSGNGNDRFQNTTANKPVLRQNGSGFYYLEYDGFDDFLQTTSVNFTATDAMTLFCGVRKISDSGVTAILIELSVNSGSNNGSFRLAAPRTSAVSVAYGNRGTTLTEYNYPNSSGFVAPATAVLTGSGDISTDTCALRINGAVAGSNPGDQGTGNYGNYPIYVGRRAGSSLPFTGHEYATVIRGAETDTALIQQVEDAINSFTEAY